MKPFDQMTRDELIEQLYKEVTFFDENLFSLSLCALIVKQIPKKFVYRLISKMYRLRTGGNK